MMSALRGLLLTMVVIALVTSVWANDTLVTLGAGGLIPRKSSTIAMVSEELQVSVHEIRVKYVFRNDSAQAIDATMAFPLPELNGEEIANEPIEFPAPSPINFMDFRVLVGGKRVTPMMEVRTFAAGHDITALLRSLRLPLSVLDREALDLAIPALPANQRRLLEKGLVEKVVERDRRQQTVAIHYWPHWQTSIEYYWNQHFQARSEIEVRHEYRPVVGGSFITKDYTSNKYGKQYCGNAETLRQIRAAQQRPGVDANDIVLFEREVRYILTTANNWSGPIQRFHLSVSADPGDILTTCMEGMKPAGPGRYELVRSNFRPTRELELLILKPKNR